MAMWPFDEDDRQTRYEPAAICRRGHVETTDIRNSEVPKRCPECGAEVLTACPSCGHRIRGYRSVPGVVDLTGQYARPDFCDECSTPFPWVTRQGRIYELMNLLDQEDLDAATELEVREQLEALADSEIDDAEAKRRWQRVKKGAPGLWEKSGARNILETVVSAAIKGGLGL
jgi:hypothetical protein